MRFTELLEGHVVRRVLEAGRGADIRIAKPDVGAVGVEENVGRVDVKVCELLQLCIGLLFAVHKARSIAESGEDAPDLLLSETSVCLGLRHHHIVESINAIGDTHGQYGSGVIVEVMGNARQIRAEDVRLNGGRRAVELVVLARALPKDGLMRILKSTI